MLTLHVFGNKQEVARAEKQTLSRNEFFTFIGNKPLARRFDRVVVHVPIISIEETDWFDRVARTAVKPGGTICWESGDQLLDATLDLQNYVHNLLLKEHE